MYFYFYMGLYLRNLNSSFFVSCIMLTCVSGMMCLEFQVQTSLLLFGCPVVSSSLGARGPQHTRPFCPSPSPEVCPSLYPLHWWCHPAILSSDVLFSCLQSFPNIRDFSNELSVCIRWPKYWSFSFTINLSNEYSGLISLKIYWFDLN